MHGMQASIFKLMLRSPASFVLLYVFFFSHFSGLAFHRIRFIVWLPACCHLSSTLAFCLYTPRAVDLVGAVGLKNGQDVVPYLFFVVFVPEITNFTKPPLA